jgi:DNA-binding SARP family transcriptional activator/predicted ATPase
VSSFRLSLLGAPCLERDGVPLGLGARKNVALVAYLAVTDKSHSREALITLLWPELEPSRARGGLRRNLSELKKALGGELLVVDRESVGLDPGADRWLDVDQFRGLLQVWQGHDHPQDEVCPDCLTSLAEAVELYRGDFLEGFSLRDSPNFDEWQFFQTEGLRQELAATLERLVRVHSAQGDCALAIPYARRWLALDPLHEQAHRHLMRLYAWSDQRAAALRQYQECVRILESELGVEPAAETRRLYEQIRDGELSKGAREQGSPSASLRTGRGDSVVAPPPAFLSSAPPHPGPPAPLVARERELARLGGDLAAALAGRGRVVFVIGGPGRGKTALIQEFARRAQDRSDDLIFAGGNCNAHTGFGDPYLPFREILGLLTGDVDALWAAGAITREHARRLWDTFPLAVQALVEVGPDLIDTFIPGRALVRRASAYAAGGIDGQAAWRTELEELVEHKAAVPHDPNLHQSALFEQYTRVVGALARERPLLLAVDDLQWADVGSISLLFHLGRGVAGGRVLIVGGYRPEEVAPGRPSAPAPAPQVQTGERERHPLEPVVHEFQRSFGDIVIDLAQAEGRPFVEEYLDTEPNRLSAGFREKLYQQTKGHPLFTVELLHGMQERGDLIQDSEGRWVEGSALDWETLPARVEAAIAERIDRLGAPSREALRVASVEGETFTAEVVARVRSTDKREMVERLSGQLERRHRLVCAQEIQRLGARRLSRYRFRHILFQNYLYHGLDPVERAHLHEAVGRALEDLCGEETEHMAVILARHFQEAGIAEKAIAYLLQAGEQAKRSSANEAAITHLTRGLALLETTPETPDRDQRELDLQIALGVPLVLIKGHAAPEVEATYARARELCEPAYAGDIPQRFQVLMGLRRYYLARGELGTAHELGEELLILAQSVQDPTHLSRAHMMHADTLDSLGEFAQVLDHCQQGIAVYDPRQSRSHMFLFGNDTAVGCQMYEALALWHLGYPDQAMRRANESLTLAHELSHPFTLVFALYYTARLHMLRVEVRAVQEHVEAVLRIATERGFALFQAFGTVLRGWALAEGGEIEEGIWKMQQGLAAWRAMGLAVVLPESLSFLAGAYGKAGQAEEGLRLVSEALTRVERTGERKFEAELYRLKGELLLGQVEADRCYREAEKCFERALEFARGQRAKSWELRAATSLSRLWHTQGRGEEARELLQEVYGWFTEGFDTADLTEAKALLDALG